MPELPEVEVSRLGLTPHIEHKILTQVIARRDTLRLPIPGDLQEKIQGHTLQSIQRRGKYLLFHWPSAHGWLILHLGMSGSLRIIDTGTPAEKHDHFDLVFSNITMRLKDPRRFGLVTWHEGENVEQHSLLASLGLEPLSENFSGNWLLEKIKKRQQPIKQLLMDAHTLVGVGNIYAAESLFSAGISPLTPACTLSPERLNQLVTSVKTILSNAIALGGSSVRNYVHSDGGAGNFQLQCNVYGRTGEPCFKCQNPILQIRQAGRSSFYCPVCQN